MDFFKKNLLSLGLGIVGLLLLLVGIFSAMVKSSKPPASVEIIPASESESVKIYVHVAGAVANPGLYLLNPEARVNDALLAAGGLNDQADQDYLAKNINLALKLTDGVKLYIPFKEELGKGTVLLNSQGQVAGDTVNALSGVNINTADLAGLQSLTGIGPVYAQKIIDFRNANGPFSKIEDVMQVEGIGEKIFSNIKDQITVF